jgi:hypothetical protein
MKIYCHHYMKLSSNSMKTLQYISQLKSLLIIIIVLFQNTLGEYILQIEFLI